MAAMEADDPQVKEWVNEQIELRKKVITFDTEEWQLTKRVYDSAVVDESSPDVEPYVRFVAGMDISYLKSRDSCGCVALVVCELPSLKVVYQRYEMVEMDVPYVAGFLSFHEAKFMIKLFNDASHEMKSECLPQVLLIDGNGLLHVRECGLACHVGVNLDIPAVGVAKNLYHVNGIARDENHMRMISALCHKGASFDLEDANGQVLGKALKSCEDAKKPIYVSVGHKISLDTAAWLITLCSKHRVPEPTRQADILSREYLREKFPNS